MVGIGNAVFLQLPGTSDRPVLHPAKVLGLKDDNCTVIAEAEDLNIEAGQDILVYFDLNRDFMKQAARVDSIDTDCSNTDTDCVNENDPCSSGTNSETPSGLTVSLTTMGVPASAERRETYRVSTVMMNLTTSFGKETACPILDVSATGFAVMSKVHYELANMADATIFVDDKSYSGKVSVQSIRDLGSGRFRYGLLGIDESRSDAALSKGLHLMSVKTQREQLRRLSGAV